jgi:nicotinamidase-related amidase
MTQALLLIDIQNDYFTGGKMELHQPLKALDNAELVLKRFRRIGAPVIHVQHISINEGATFFLPDTEGVKIHERLTPLSTETVVVKHAPNSFFNTNLLDILRDHQITDLVACGMMSHMCIDTTVRACKDLELKVTLLEDACATKDLAFRGEMIPAKTVHCTFMAALNGIFAWVIGTEEYLAE